MLTLYQDIIILVRQGEDRKPEIRLSLIREFAKGIQDLQSRSDLKAFYYWQYKLISLNRPQYLINKNITSLLLILNPILFILGIALASCVFKYYETADEIFDLEPPQYNNHQILEQADHIQDVPVFQSATCDGPTKKI